jgi:hypothetical protein
MKKYGKNQSVPAIVGKSFRRVEVAKIRAARVGRSHPYES